MASIETLKTSIRIIWYKDGKKDSETLKDTPPTPANIAHANRIADMVEQQIQMGIFNRDQVFPDSPKAKGGAFRLLHQALAYRRKKHSRPYHMGNVSK